MTMLLLGLLIFLGLHSLRIVAEPTRTRWRERLGEQRYKGLYTVLSLGGFGLVCWGFGLARQTPVVLWDTPAAMRHVAALLTWPAFILLAASHAKGNAIKAQVGHPMVIGTALWALGHLLANNTLAEVCLFGSFLLWSLASWQAARRRDRLQPPAPVVVRTRATVITVLAGTAVWLAFALWGHRWLIGVAPFVRP